MRGRRVRNRRSARGSSSRERSASIQERTVRPPVVPTTDLHFGDDHVDVSSRAGSRKRTWLQDAFVGCRSQALTRRESSNSHDPAPSSRPCSTSKDLDGARSLESRSSSRSLRVRSIRWTRHGSCFETEPTSRREDGRRRASHPASCASQNVVNRASNAETEGRRCLRSLEERSTAKHGPGKVKQDRSRATRTPKEKVALRTESL